MKYICLAQTHYTLDPDGILSKHFGRKIFGPIFQFWYKYFSKQTPFSFQMFSSNRKKERNNEKKNYSTKERLIGKIYSTYGPSLMLTLKKRLKCSWRDLWYFGKITIRTDIELNMPHFSGMNNASVQFMQANRKGSSPFA